MSAYRPSVLTPTDESGLSRTTLFAVPGGRDAQEVGVIAAQLAAETGTLLAALEGTVGRLAIAHRSCTLDADDQTMDDDAFAWVQQSLEDISATLRGLSLNRPVVDSPRIRSAIHAVNSRV